MLMARARQHGYWYPVIIYISGQEPVVARYAATPPIDERTAEGSFGLMVTISGPSTDGSISASPRTAQRQCAWPRVGVSLASVTAAPAGKRSARRIAARLGRAAGFSRRAPSSRWAPLSSSAHVDASEMIGAYLRRALVYARRRAPAEAPAQSMRSRRDLGAISARSRRDDAQLAVDDDDAAHTQFDSARRRAQLHHRRLSCAAGMSASAHRATRRHGGGAFLDAGVDARLDGHFALALPPPVAVRASAHLVVAADLRACVCACAWLRW